MGFLGFLPQKNFNLSLVEILETSQNNHPFFLETSQNNEFIIILPHSYNLLDSLPKQNSLFFLTGYYRNSSIDITTNRLLKLTSLKQQRETIALWIYCHIRERELINDIFNPAKTY